MKTPKEYNDLIKQNKVTKNILGEVVFSINKRAKNWRDKKREYKNKRYDRYGNYEKSLENEQKYYKLKSDMLSKFEPLKIHKDIKEKEVIYKIYSYDVDFYTAENVIDEGAYFDREINDYIEFKKVKEKKINELYFLYHKIGNYDFHTPIEEEDLKKYDLEIETIDNFMTFGEDINDLLSTQFCQKVYDLFINDKLEIID